MKLNAAATAAAVVIAVQQRTRQTLQTRLTDYMIRKAESIAGRTLGCGSSDMSIVSSSPSVSVLRPSVPGLDLSAGQNARAVSKSSWVGKGPKAGLIRSNVERLRSAN